MPEFDRNKLCIRFAVVAEKLTNRNDGQNEPGVNLFAALLRVLVSEYNSAFGIRNAHRLLRRPANHAPPAILHNFGTIPVRLWNSNV